MSQAIVNFLGYLFGHGIATGGTKTTLIDTSKVYEADVLNGTIVRIHAGGIDYYRTISDTAGSTITFATLPGTPAANVWTVSSGVTITTTAAADGTAGNAYTLVAALNAEASQNLAVALVGKVITVTLATGANSLSDDVKNTVTLVTAAIEALADLTAVAGGSGATVVGETTALTFTGGIDAVIPNTTTRYQLAVSQIKIT